MTYLLGFNDNIHNNKRINALKEKTVHEVLGVHSIQNYLINPRQSEKDISCHRKNLIDKKLRSRSFLETINNIIDANNNGNEFGGKISTILAEKSIYLMDGDIAKGSFSLAIDIGENQILHISSPNNNKKTHIRYKEPEIIQPLCVLYNDSNLKIEITPKVKTEGVTDEHIYSLISSLAKKGLLFSDCKKENIGLIEINGKDIPVVIGDGAVVEIAKCNDNYYRKNENHIDYFYRKFKALLNSEYDIDNRFSNGLELCNFFKSNEKYTHYPWVDVVTGKLAQDVYIKEKGLKKGEVKGIITKTIISELQQIDLSKSPIAKEIVDLTADNHLREQDVKKLASKTIERKWGDKFQSKEEFIEFAQQNKTAITR